jgi:hypothetical protein
MSRGRKTCKMRQLIRFATWAVATLQQQQQQMLRPQSASESNAHQLISQTPALPDPAADIIPPGAADSSPAGASNAAGVRFSRRLRGEASEFNPRALPASRRWIQRISLVQLLTAGLLQPAEDGEQWKFGARGQHLRTVYVLPTGARLAICMPGLEGGPQRNASCAMSGSESRQGLHALPYRSAARTRS